MLLNRLEHSANTGNAQKVKYQPDDIQKNSASNAKPVAGTSDHVRQPIGSKKNRSVNTTTGGMVNAMISFEHQKPYALDR